MTKRMLIDATHAEETRVVVLEGNRLEDFDVETQSRRQLKGNIYLAKVVRVEPSLQAAFVEYGGNRHGFLAFSEIHPDYYQIPVADRQRLLQMQEEEARAEEEEEDHFGDGGRHNGQSGPATQPLAADHETIRGEASEFADAEDEPVHPTADTDGVTAAVPDAGAGPTENLSENRGAELDEGATESPTAHADFGPGTAPETAEPAPADAMPHDDAAPRDHESDAPPRDHESDAPRNDAARNDDNLGSRVQEVPQLDAAPPETIGGEHDTGDDVRERRQPPRFMRNYKIQEVIRRRQILLIQVVKEERGTKGAALTTYISLAGRYCVLMPNSPRGGGISRKITSATDRRRLKEVTSELEIPRGMSLIVRTAGANRPKPEIKRDCEYLLRLWDDIRDHTLKSVAPALIYEEANLIKRAIRDVYSRDVDEVIVDGEEGWKAARDFMRMLMPTHVKKVQLWRDGGAPLFARQQVEAQLDAMLSPTVQLRSGGYLVINQTEALVAIDVNSGRSTRERGIEETATRTNLEAADEVARQLRLRDLAGLIVIDFIDMESKKNNVSVERRLKEALKADRARIQVGQISHFGLMEMSRQRLRPSLAETSLTACPHCGGTGHVRSTESAALHLLRAIEEEGSKRRAAEIMVHVPAAAALYILNHKRQRLTDIELRYGMRVGFAADESLLPSQPRIDRLRAQIASELPPPVTSAPTAYEEAPPEPEEVEAEIEADTDADDAADPDNAPVPGETAEEGERRRRRRRRRRRGGPRRDDAAPGTDATPMPPGTEQPEIGDAPFPVIPAVIAAPIPVPEAEPHAPVAAEIVPEPASAPSAPVEIPISAAPPSAEAPTETPAEAPAEERPRRPRARRKKRVDAVPEAEAPAAPPPYAGPTPANPFGGGTLDIFDVLEQAETVQLAAAAAAPAQATPPKVTAAPPAPQPAIATQAAPAPAAVEPVVTEPVIGPAIQPVIIGETAPAAEKKRGWWRR
jgi:ribonuclease E